jgi:hypothetical protein
VRRRDRPRGRAARRPAREQVVVGHDAQTALAQLELLAAAWASRRRRPGLDAARPRGLQRGVGVAHRLPDDLQRLGAVERHVLGVVEGADVEVVDDLVDEVAEVLDER